MFYLVKYRNVSLPQPPRRPKWYDKTKLLWGVHDKTRITIKNIHTPSITNTISSWNCNKILLFEGISFQGNSTHIEAPDSINVEIFLWFKIGNISRMLHGFLKCTFILCSFHHKVLAPDRGNQGNKMFELDGLLRVHLWSYHPFIWNTWFFKYFLFNFPQILQLDFSLTLFSLDSFFSQFTNV